MLLATACRSPAARDDPGAAEAAPAIVDSEIQAVSCNGDVTCKLVGVVPEHVHEFDGRRAAIVEHACGTLGLRDGEGTAYATWLLAGGPGRVHRVQLLSDRCSPKGVPSIAFLESAQIREIQTDALTDAGAPAKWTIADIALDPPRLVRETHAMAFLGGGEMEKAWDFELARGGECTRSSTDEPCEIRGRAVPLLTVADPAFAAGGWKGTSLGDCGSYLYEAADEAAHRAADAGTHTVVRALLTDWDMYVEVSDDAFVVAGKVVDQFAMEMMADEAAQGAGWELTMDGRVHSLRGPKPKVEMVSVSPTLRRFKLTWDGVSWRQHIAVSYSDTADGINERTVLSNGPEPGILRRVLPKEAVCVPEGGALHVRRSPVAPAPLEPLIR